MKILIIGGTKFLGRHLIEAASESGHELTLFNRGRFSQETFGNVEQIHGDRNFELEKLVGRRFDVCIDTCGYLPQSVKTSVEFLRESVGQYIFISSISAYKDFREINADENAPLAELTAEQREKFEKIDVKDEVTGIVLGEMYGALKVLCEREAEKAMPQRVLTVRPGLIVGEFDWTDRFSYWVMRVAKGGEVLAPGDPQRFIQFIDARDLAKWTIKMAEENQNGIFNVTGKPFNLSFGRFLEEIKNVTQSDAKFTWVSEEFLKKQNVEVWSEMPLYLHGSDADWQGFLSVNIDKALEKGLNFYALDDTIRTTFNWRNSVEDELKAGISAERESELLKKWHARQ
ncbi:MAG: NAD-dependent epimerase/dehydratase family protein [Pyrinomonadaceae bacterium]|nr:NAD-dependent epimerase/dehydratase family protein [Pyrinomonadaceae bacterium]